MCERCKELMILIKQCLDVKEEVIEIVKDIIVDMNSDDKQLRKILKILGVEENEDNSDCKSEGWSRKDHNSN